MPKHSPASGGGPNGFRNLSQTIGNLSGNTQGHWNYDGVLTDLSGNDFTLTADGATPTYPTIDGLQCIDLTLLANTLSRVNEPELEITGALTVH